MTPQQSTDVLIIGAGPAGTCAALRLLALGHKVTLAECDIFPRPQIGESLSPGIRNIFDYLDATHLLTRHNYLHQLNARVIWDTPAPQTVSAEQRGPGIMVDRGLLDKDLLNLAVERGLQLYQPARFESCQQTDTGWQSQLRLETQLVTITSKFILDARGRRGNNMQDRVLTAPPTVAIWGHLPAHLMPADTYIEATERGWIWGCPTPNGQFRTITFIDPKELRGHTVPAVFKSMLSNARLFQPIHEKKMNDLQTCTVFTYAHTAPWQDNYLRLGEAAFSLDPLSSTGVEKAMRFSLQAVIAVNTILKTSQTNLAQAFYEDNMISSVSSHTHWTSSYYAQAWPGRQHAFWRERSVPFIDQRTMPTAFYNRLKEKFIPPKEKGPERQINVQQELQRLWHEHIYLSPSLVFREMPCVVDDMLQVRMAIHHPNLDREIAYLEAVEISPLLSTMADATTFGDVVREWSRILPFEQAVRIAFFLWDKDILCTQTQ